MTHRMLFRFREAAPERLHVSSKPNDSKPNEKNEKKTIMTTDPDPLLLGEWFARYRMRMKFGKPNQVEAYDKLRAILGMEADR